MSRKKLFLALFALTATPAHARTLRSVPVSLKTVIVGRTPMLSQGLAAPTLSLQSIQPGLPTSMLPVLETIAIPTNPLASKAPVAARITVQPDRPWVEANPARRETLVSKTAQLFQRQGSKQSKLSIIFDNRQSVGAVNAADTPSPAQQASNITTRIIVGPNTFKIGDLSDLINDEFQARIRAISEAKERDDFIKAYTPIDDYDVRYVMEELMHEELEKRWDKARKVGKKEFMRQHALFLKEVKAFNKRLPRLVKKRFNQTIKNYTVSETSRDEYSVLTIQNGLAFWDSFLKSDSLDERIAAAVFLRTQSRRAETDYPVRLLTGLSDRLSYPTQILDTTHLKNHELSVVRRHTLAGKRKSARVGDYLLVGGGNSFFLARKILEAAAKLADKTLSARIYRAVLFLISRGIPIIYDEHQGAAAYYNPSEDQMAYVMPSRADLNTTSHEANHARFQKFQESLRRWIDKKGWAVPYEIDGPSYALFGSVFGSYMNLLNELNSWRIGESFDGGKTDAEILKILRRAYGKQVGWNNVRRWSKQWPARRVKGRSVPKLILESVRKLNTLNEDEISALADAAHEENDAIKAQNFMRLIHARYPEKDSIPAGWSAHVHRFLDFTNDDVKWTARAILEIPQPEWKSDAEEVDAVVSKLTAKDADYKATVRQLVNIVKQSLTEDTPETKGQQDRAKSILEGAMDAWKIEDLHTARALKSMNSIDGNKPGDEGWYENRAPALKHPLFDPRVDKAFAETMFDGARSVHRLDIVNLIRMRTHPEELPIVNKRLRTVIAADDVRQNDLWIARIFLVPGTEFFAVHVAWGESVIDAIRRDETPSAEALEFAGEYYRLSLARALPGPRWGIAIKLSISDFPN